jgi:hypothetical protein
MVLNAIPLLPKFLHVGLRREPLPFAAIQEET